MIPSLVVFAASCLAAAAMTAWLARHAPRLELLDVPNERSSHSSPTPRGGGLAIVVVTLGAVVVAGGRGDLDARIVVALLGGLPVAVVGWVDDLREVAPWARLLVHFLAALWMVQWMREVGPPAPGPLGGGLVATGVLVVATVWSINLYNFMDGIDGLAAGEAVLVGLFGALLLTGDAATGLRQVAAAVAGGSLGFLFFNWAPARIFMGDVGSGFLGFAFAALAVASEALDSLPALAWVLLGGVFVVDATLTLLRRLAARERVWEPHREHAYQRVIRAGGSHRAVALGAAALNLVLGGLALAVWRGPLEAGYALAGAGAVLVGAYLGVQAVEIPEPPRADPAVSLPSRRTS